ncbi:MAG: protein kinase [bacterium]|nr:protein kinase [bacterium]
MRSEYRDKADHAYALGNISDAAEWYYRAGDFGRAAGLFEREKEYLKAAQCYFKNQEYTAAAHNFQKIGREEKAAQMFEIGREFEKAAVIFFRLEKYGAAAELYERSSNYLLAGEAFYLAKNNQSALRNLEKVPYETEPGQTGNGGPGQTGNGGPGQNIRNIPGDNFLRARLKMAEILLIEGQPRVLIDAIGCRIEGHLVSERNVHLCFMLGQAYERTRDFGKAIGIFREIEDFDSGYPGIRGKIDEVRRIVSKTIEVGHSERYRRKKQVGCGATGVVYKVEDYHLKRLVALKILNAGAVAAYADIKLFLSEARKVAKLQHPNIVTVYDVGRMNSNYFISMEYIEGGNLLVLIKKKHPVPAADILIIAGKLFTALEHSHSKGVIHRDIKPNNIMITLEGEVKVVDFGIAALGEELKRENKSKIYGTPYYMSPEQVEGITVDSRTDIYSAGVTLFHLICGVPPFYGTVLEILEKHLGEPVPSIRKYRQDIPAGLIKIVERCMAKSRDIRYQDAGEVLEEIEKVKDLDGRVINTGATKLAIADSPDLPTIRLD